MQVSLRPAVPEDAEFLQWVYASTRAAELALVDWSDEQKEAFVSMQYKAQRQSYRTQFPQASYEIILAGEIPIGRLILDRTGSRILVVDIALLPQQRNMGIGTSLIRDLQVEAERAGKALRLHVESHNPAQKLYAGLGFKKIHEAGMHCLMEWSPGSKSVCGSAAAPV